MTVETRYFCSDTQTINGLLGYKLETTNTNSYVLKAHAYCIALGIRVWKRAASGTETEITSSDLVAQVAPSTVTAEVDGTWNCPLTSLVSTDSIVVRVYALDEDGTTQYLLATFTTGQLGSQSLDWATWTVHYWCKYTIATGSVSFYFGSVVYNSRITNFTWTPYVAPSIPSGLMDGFVLVS